MSFDDDQKRSTASFAGGLKFETWKDYSFFAATYYLPAATADYQRHPVDGFDLQPGCVYWNRAAEEMRVYNGTTWVPFSKFTGLSDTPPGFAGAALQVLRVNAAEDAVEFRTLTYSDLAEIPTEFPPGDHTHVLGDLPDEVTASNVAEVITQPWQFNVGATIGPNGYNMIPPGGAEGQVLAKVNSQNYNTEWADPAEGTFDPAFGYTITGQWTINASWDIQDLTLRDALRMSSGGTQRWAATWDADSLTINDEAGRAALKAYDAGAAGGARLEIGDTGLGERVAVFTDADYSLLIDAGASGEGAKVRLLSDNAAADRETIVWHRADGAEEMRAVMKADDSLAIQANGASGWQDVMTFGQDYKPRVASTGMEMQHADDGGSVRVPRIFVQATPPDLSESEDGDLWFRPAT